MNKKITFGAIKLKASKTSDDTAALTQGEWKKINKKNIFCCGKSLTFSFKTFSKGFGTFGKTSKNEDVDDVESQHVKNIMGISAFGRKAKNFDITVSKQRYFIQ